MLNFLGYGRENCLASLSLLFGVGKKAIVRMPKGRKKKAYTIGYRIIKESKQTVK